jgi:hypothetical protein
MRIALDRKSWAWSIARPLLSVFLLLLISTTAFGVTYSCGDPSSNHCYGVTSWQEKPEYFGAYSDILRASMNCPSGCNGFVDNELWLVDDKSGGCTGNPFGMCWVEAGYFFTDGSSSAQFFWADSRPMNSSTFNLHILGSADSEGTTDHYMIIKDARGGPGIFQVWVYNDGLSTLYQGTSTSNTMAGDRVIIGQELAGTNGASAGTANFTRNIWAVQTLGPEYVFWYNSQTTKSGVTSANPPIASWTIDPTSPPPPEGGQFTTHCCS